MITINKDIKNERANDTLCRGISIKLKKNEELKWKNLDGRRLLSVSMENVDYMICEHWKEMNSVTSGGIFKILPGKNLL